MDSIQLHIDYLVRRHECVILPGLGAVISSYRSARFVEETGEMLPPGREFAFNAEIKSNDGLLANSIARRRKISYDEAVTEMTAELAGISCQLKAESEVNIGNVGRLVMEDGCIVFRPFATLAERAARLGLVPLRICEAEGVREEVNEPEVANIEPVSAEEVAESGVGREFNTRKFYYIPVRKSLAKIAAAVVAVAAIGISIFLPFKDNTTHRELASVVPVKEVAAVVVPQNQPAEEKVAPEAVTEDYRVVVGTFTTEGELERFLEAHKVSPFKLEVLRQGKLIYAVAATSTSMEEMREFKRDAEFHAEYPNAWILTYSPQ